MRLKLAQCCVDPKKVPQKTPKNNEIQNFEPPPPPKKKNSLSLGMRENIRVPPPPPPPGIETMHKLKTAHSFSRLSPALFRGWGGGGVGGMVTNGWCIIYSYQHP